MAGGIGRRGAADGARHALGGLSHVDAAFGLLREAHGSSSLLFHADGGGGVSPLRCRRLEESAVSVG